MEFADYKIEEDGRVLCEPCLCFVYFSDVILTKDAPPDLLGPYRAFLDEFKGAVTFSRSSGNQMHAKPITSEDLLAWPNWLDDPVRRSKGDFVVELRSGKTRDDWVAPFFEVRYSTIGGSNTYYRICLPLTWLRKQGVTGVVGNIQKSMAEFPLHSGYVGYGFSWQRSTPHVIDVTEPYFAKWLQRHPGIVAPQAGTQSATIPYSISDLGWITLLGEANTSKLGGIATLRDALAPIRDVVVTEIGNGGVMIRIGDSPRMGDTTSGDNLDDYRAVGAVLAPLRDNAVLDERWVIHGLDGRDFPEELRTGWINRFFPAN